MSAAASTKGPAKKLTIAGANAAFQDLLLHAADEHVDAFAKIIEESGIDLWKPISSKDAPTIYRILGSEMFVTETKRGFATTTNVPSEAVCEYLMRMYYRKFPLTDFFYVKDELRRPMLSQKGATCVSDAFYTILFESEILRPYTLLVKERLPADDKFFRAGLCAAMERHDRINFTQRERRLSISNNLWKEGHVMLQGSNENEGEGVVLSPLRMLLMNMFGKENIYEIPELEGRFDIGRIPEKYSDKELKTSPELYNRFKNSFAFIVGWERMSFAPGDRLRHGVGFMKNRGVWHILDNEVGYIHPVQDTDWFENIFLPRLNFSIAGYKSLRAGAAYGNIPLLHQRVLAYSHPIVDDLRTDFITMGARSYPNEFERHFLFDAESRDKLWAPYEVVFIGEMGGGAGAGAHGGRRKTRRHPRTK